MSKTVNMALLHLEWLLLPFHPVHTCKPGDPPFLPVVAYYARFHSLCWLFLKCVTIFSEPAVGSLRSFSCLGVNILSCIEVQSWQQSFTCVPLSSQSLLHVPRHVNYHICKCTATRLLPLLVRLPGTTFRDPVYNLERHQSRSAGSCWQHLRASARLNDHITPLLHSLHWLRVAERITFRLAVLAYRCLHGSAPEYLTSLLQCVSGIHTCQRLRSSSSSDLMVPRTIRFTIGELSFQSAAASTWNALPRVVCPFFGISATVQKSTRDRTILAFISAVLTEFVSASLWLNILFCALEVFGFTSR